MHFDISLFLYALGLSAVLEALPWLISPDKMREAVMHLADLSPAQIRAVCLVMLGLGRLFCAAGRSFH